MMHSEIIIKAFEKAKQNLLKESGIKPSTLKCSKNISEYISDNSNIPFGSKSLRNAYKACNENKKVEIKQPQVINALCKYIGYENYKEYVLKNHKENDNNQNEDQEKIIYHSEFSNGKSSITVQPKNKKLFAWFSNASAANKYILFTSISIIVIITITYFFKDSTILTSNLKCMTWQNDHYIEVVCDLNKLQIGQHKLYKEGRINNFKQVYPDSTYTFFEPNGNVTIWYGKNEKGDLEFFTDIGLHPETGKTLKPITQYMIDKYLKK